MLLSIAALIAALALLLASVTSALALALVARATSTPIRAPSARAHDPMSDDVKDFIDLESEPWAREAVGSRAQDLYAKVKDWHEVLAVLKHENPVTPTQAVDHAWERSMTDVDLVPGKGTMAVPIQGEGF